MIEPLKRKCVQCCKYQTPRLHNGVTGNSGILLNMIAYKGQITNKGRTGGGGGGGGGGRGG